MDTRSKLRRVLAPAAMILLLAAGGCGKDKGQDVPSDTAPPTVTNPNDRDGDGFLETDCNPDDGDTYPGAPDTFGDGVDQNCDAADGVDYDGDGHADIPSGGEDCDDGDPNIFPRTYDALGDGIDSNCDGHDGADYDQDGHADYPSGGDDCDDGDPQIHPGADDFYGDDKDTDCDGVDG